MATGFGIISETTLNDGPVSLERGRVSTRLQDTIMTSNTTDRQLVWVVLAILAALVVLALFGMLWARPMMGGMWGTGMWGVDGMSGWMLITGLGMQLLVVAIIVGAIYLGYRAVTGRDDSTDPAVEELRAAYACGELSDDEYERRRDRLKSES